MCGQLHKRKLSSSWMFVCCRVVLREVQCILLAMSNELGVLVAQYLFMQVSGKGAFSTTLQALSFVAF